jgi:hypothetical protein
MVSGIWLPPVPTSLAQSLSPVTGMIVDVHLLLFYCQVTTDSYDVIKMARGRSGLAMVN